jgi:hypothetical protein
VRERFRRLLAEIGGHRAVELAEQARGLVEMEGADLDELVARTLAEPAGEAAVQVCAGARRAS